MALWTATQMSEILECSPQNVNQQKTKLRKLGYLEIDPTDNKEKINENGYNYLLNKRKITMQIKGNTTNNLNNACLNNEENATDNGNIDIKQDFVYKLLQDQVEELKTRLAEETEQRKHWQELYIKQNEDYKKITFPIMIGTEEQNKKQEEETKKGFFSRLFNK